MTRDCERSRPAFQAPGRDVLELLAHSPRISGDRLMRAWINEMDCVLRHSLRSKFLGVLRKVPGQPFAMKAADKDISVAPASSIASSGIVSLPVRAASKFARKSSAEITGSGLPGSHEAI